MSRKRAEYFEKLFILFIICSSNKILLQEITLDKKQQSIIRNFVNRRINKEPFQYIIQKASFYGRDIYVSPQGLIPRPETETIIQILTKEGKKYNKALDIGTGSGNLSLTLSLEKLANHIVALDKSKRSLEIAQINFSNYNITNIQCIQDDFLKYEIKMFYQTNLCRLLLI